MSTPLTRAALRAVPLCFVLGAGIELFMIKVRIGSETFCAAVLHLLGRSDATDDTAVRLEAKKRAEKEKEDTTTTTSH